MPPPTPTVNTTTAFSTGADVPEVQATDGDSAESTTALAAMSAATERKKEWILFLISAGSLIASLISLVMTFITSGDFFRNNQNIIILTAIIVLAAIAFFLMVDNGKLTRDYIKQGRFVESINHKLNLNQSSSLSIAKLFMALSYARVNFSNANLALVQYLGAHPDASTKGHELYTDYRVLAERLHRERRTYLKCACNTLAQVIERMKRSSGANIIINTNIKLMVDQDNYITVMRSDNSNLLRAVDDKQPLILRENELLHEFSRAPLSYLKVDDISEEYINVKSRHRSFRFPNISSVAFYRSCLIVPIHGTMPRFDTSDHQKISDVPVTIAYLMADSTDLAVFNEDFDLSVMTQLANYIFSMYTEYWSAVSGAGEIQS